MTEVSRARSALRDLAGLYGAAGEDVARACDALRDIDADVFANGEAVSDARTMAAMRAATFAVRLLAASYDVSDARDIARRHAAEAMLHGAIIAGHTEAAPAAAGDA